MMEPFTLFSAKSSGGTLVELLLKRSKLNYRVQYFDWSDLGNANGYREINPVAQVPSLKLPTGEIMTESLAICYYLSEIADLGLVPKTSDKEYPKFLRWAVFMVASIYSTFTFSDHPDRWVTRQESQTEIVAKMDQYRKELWTLVEKEAGEPWFLGEKESLIDVYMSVMTYWRPGRKWFEESCPRIMQIAGRAEATENYRVVFENNRS